MDDAARARVPDAPGPKGAARSGELALRIASSIALAPLAIGAAYVGGRIFVLFWCVAALVVLWEWAGLVAPDARLRIMGVAGSAIVLAALGVATGRPAEAVVAVLLGAVAAAFVQPQRRAWVGGGSLYAAAILLAPALLRRDHDLGLSAVIMLFAIVWATDICAYFAGRALGGPRLVPRISPNKTWSGAISGTLAAVVAGVAVGFAAGLQRVAMIAAIAFVLTVASQIGDLFESFVKRKFGAKDASHIIPGHGGLMDRLDGFVAAALVGTVIGILRGGIEHPARGLLAW